MRSRFRPIIAASLVILALAAGCAGRSPAPIGEVRTVGPHREHVLLQGDGPAVVFVHGNPGTLNEFARYTRPALAGYRTMAWDRPGYGHSERPSPDLARPQAQADYLHGILGRLGIERPILVSHSWGTTVALAYALSYPETVRGLVLTAPLSRPLGRMDWLGKPPVSWLLAHGLPGFVTGALTYNMLASAFDPEPMPAGFWEAAEPLWLQGKQLEASLQDSVAAGPALAGFWPHLHQLSMPVTIVAGGSDRATRPEIHAEPLAKAIPGARLTILSGAGHEVPYTRPQAVREAVDWVVRAANGNR